MISIREEKKNNSSYYVIEFKNDNGKVESSIDVKYKVYIRTPSKKTYYLLYDNQARLNETVYQFLNHYNYSKSKNSKKKSLYALKLLYSYAAIISKEFEDFNNEDFVNLIFFLRGNEYVGGNIEYHNLTKRSKTSINGYLAIYREYFEYLGLSKDSVLFKTMNRGMKYVDQHDYEHIIKQYRLNEKIPKKQVEVPDYISLKEYKKIIEYISQTKTARDEIIVRLMYEDGLRIGEVLGLTKEDVALEEDANTGDYISVVYLRNRLTDKHYQNAKSCMKVHSTQTYRSNDYKKEGIGYQKIILSNNLYEKICNYIEETHVKYQKTSYEQYKNESEKYRDTFERYQKKTIADSVTDKNSDNFYIFVNATKTPLSGDVWRKVIVDIFEHNGIQVDKEVKEHNLNHRFRHGFAMLNVQYFHKDQYELQLLLRHKHLSSVSCYYKPTKAEQIEILNDLTNNIYSFLDKEIYEPLKIKNEEMDLTAKNNTDSKDKEETKPIRNRFSVDF